MSISDEKTLTEGQPDMVGSGGVGLVDVGLAVVVGLVIVGAEPPAIPTQ